MPRQTVKQMLIELYREEREQMRCTLVHELKKESENISLPYRDNVKEIHKKLNELDKKMSDLRRLINTHNEDRDKALKSAKLYNFGTKSCGDALHPRLAEFDQVTNNHIRGILESTGKE